MVCRALQRSRGGIPDQLSTIVGCRDHEPTVRGERHSLDRVAHIVEMMQPCAGGDAPDRRVAFDATRREARTTGIPAHTPDARSLDEMNLCPRLRVKYTSTFTGCFQPTTVGAESDRRSIRCILTQLGDQRATCSVPDVRGRSTDADRRDEFVIGRPRHDGIPRLDALALQL